MKRHDGTRINSYDALTDANLLRKKTLESYRLTSSIPVLTRQTYSYDCVLLDYETSSFVSYSL